MKMKGYNNIGAFKLFVRGKKASLKDASNDWYES